MKKFSTIVVCFDGPVGVAWSAEPKEKLINNKCKIFPRIFEVQQVFSEKYTTYRVISVFFFVLDRKRLETIKNGLDLGMSISQSNQ